MPAYQRISVNVVSTITCDTCFESSINEQEESILSVPIGETIQDCVNKYLAPVPLSAPESHWLCHSCNSVRDATKYHHFACTSDVVVIQLKRFSVAHDLTIHKSSSRVNINHPLQLQIAEQNSFSEINITRNYSLRAFITHTGSLERGHYCTNVRLRNIWYKCNDAVVNEIKHLGNAFKEAYLLFYVSL